MLMELEADYTQSCCSFFTELSALLIATCWWPLGTLTTHDPGLLALEYFRSKRVVQLGTTVSWMIFSCLLRIVSRAGKLPTSMYRQYSSPPTPFLIVTPRSPDRRRRGEYDGLLFFFLAMSSSFVCPEVLYNKPIHLSGVRHKGFVVVEGKQLRF